MLMRISAAQIMGQWDPCPAASVAWVRDICFWLAVERQSGLLDTADSYLEVSYVLIMKY